jgi:hypothetical protein
MCKPTRTCLGVVRREVVQPGARPEVGPRLDQPGEHRVRLPQEHAFAVFTVETMFSSSRSRSIDRTAANCDGW